MNTGKISLVRVLALLFLMAGFQSVWADVWNGNISAPNKQTINGKEYYLIEKAEHLAWFADTVNKYAVGVKWQKMIDAIEADTSKPEYKTRAFKDSAIALMEKIKQDPESYYTDPAKKALWDKAPYKKYLQVAWNVGDIAVKLNAKITADYLDMNNLQFTPIAAGNGPAKFAGNFEGNGVTIKNLKIDSKEFKFQFYDVLNGYPSYCQNVGLFGVIGSGKVTNVILDGVTIHATGKNDFWANPNQVSVGPIAGWMNGGTIDTCFASGRILTNGRDVGAGGVIGAMTNGKSIRNALSTVSVEASGRDVYVGGIAGVIRGNATIARSVYDGDTLVAHPDEVGAQGALVGRIVNNKDISKGQTVTDSITVCLFDTDVLNGDWLGSTDTLVNVIGDPKGTSKINTEKNACLLNGYTWENDKCSDTTGGIWTNEENITNNGVSKSEEDKTVFVITFDANGGTFAPGANTSKELKFNTPLTGDEISTPIYDSTKTFAGWAKTSTATTPEDLGIVYGARTVYAVWNSLTLYKITFDFNTGDSSTTLTKMVAKDSSITTDGFAADQLPSIHKVGDAKYYFDGWSESKNGPAVDSLGVATKNVTFYARWSEAPQFKVTFDVQGHGSAPAEKLVAEGEHTTPPDEPTAIGYVFEGWYTEAACTNKYNFQTLVNSSITLYAKWLPIVYGITYNLKGGLNNVANPATYTADDEFSFAAPTINNDTLEFKGWFYDGAYTNPALQITKGSYGDVTLYANWKVKEYTINYQAGADGVNNVPSVVKKFGEDITLLGAVYLRPGYEQDGWSTLSDGDKVYDLNAVYKDNKSVTLFPHWNKVNYTITYELNGGVNDPNNPSKYTLDDTTGIELKKATRVGYDFKGWYEAADFSGSEVKNFKAKTPYGDKTLYAKWSQITVTFTAGANSCSYDGNPCGAKISSIKGLSGVYKGYAITDSIKNVNDGPIPVKIVGVAIVDTTTGDTVTDAFSIALVESGSVTVKPKSVSFKGRDSSVTYIGDSIHVNGTADAAGLLPGHTHNAGYTLDVLNAGQYAPVMMKKEEIVVLDADGNDVTANYNFGDVNPPSKKFEVKKSDGDFNVMLASEYITYDGNPHSMTHGAETDASGVTTYKYRLDGGTWKTDLSALTITEVDDHIIEVEAINSNYVNPQYQTATFGITKQIIVTITIKSQKKTYDGTPLKVVCDGSTPEICDVQGAFKTGDMPIVEVSGSITDAGSAIARVTSFKVMNGTADKTSDYVANTYDGFLTVEKAELTIKTTSGLKPYDGTPLVGALQTVKGFKNGEDNIVKVTATGSQKMVGSSTNGYTIDWGSAKAKNYQIVEDLGTLTVEKADVTITVKDVEKLYGDPDPAMMGNATGLADKTDLGELRCYRLNPTVKNAGENVDSIAVSYTPNPNYDVTVVPGKLTIKKRHVTLTSASATKVYDGTPLTNDTVTIGGDGFAPDEGAIFTVTGSQTDAGSSENTFTYVLKANTDTATNYTVDAPVFNTLKVTKAPVKVTVKGNSNTYAYNGWEQVVSGYSLKIDNSLYSVNDIVFSGDSVIRKTGSGSYAMGLKASDFTNKNANFDVAFDVTDGQLVILSREIAVKYNDAGDTIHVVIGEKDSDSEVNDKINSALENHEPPIPLPTKAADDDSTYDFAGWAKNLGTGMYEPIFDASVKLDTIQVVYQKDPEETIDVVIHVTDTYREIIQRIDSTFNEHDIELPSKPSDGDSNYVLVNWKKNDSTGVYEPEFKGELIVIEIVAQYGDSPTDTIHVKIRPKDTNTQITDKIGSALTNHLPPIKVTPKDTSYSLVGWKQDSKTGNYVPVFSKDEQLVFKINFHLPEGAELVEEFEGYVYGKVTKLPDAVMTSDTSWVFKGWYTKTKGRGDRVKAMREGDYGNKSLYPYFIKTLRYNTYGEKDVNANGQKGEVVVIYTDRADTTIARALLAVAPKDFSKGGVTYTFNGWTIKDGVYIAKFKKVSVRFNVVLDSRAFSIEEAQVGARFAVFDMDGRIVKRGVVANGSQRVEVPKSGSYTVRVGKDALQVNVK